MANFYKPSTGFVVVKMDLPNHYRCSTNFAVDKTGLTITGFTMIKMYLPNIYKPSTDFAVVKTCSTIIFHRHSKGFAVVKTGLMKLHRLSTGIVAVKTGMTILCRLSTSFQIVIGELLQAFSMLYGNQNWILKQLQAFN